jgi:catechol 2,3-dioxygenase-like lactoylglutathione lyase family enzyme
MFSHIMIGSNDIARSKKFYDALWVLSQPQKTPGADSLIRTVAAVSW